MPLVRLPVTTADHDADVLRFGEDDGALNGVTPVTVVPSPSGSDLRQVDSITVHNLDTAVVTVTIKKTGGTARTVTVKDLDPGDTLIWDTPVRIDSTRTVTVVMSGAAATTNPDWTSAWTDVTA